MKVTAHLLHDRQEAGLEQLLTTADHDRQGDVCDVAHPVATVATESGLEQLEKVADDALEGLLRHTRHHPVRFRVLLGRIVPVPQRRVPNDEIRRSDTFR